MFAAAPVHPLPPGEPPSPCRLGRRWCDSFALQHSHRVQATEAVGHFFARPLANLTVRI